jgi:peptide/nickel transport system permease protein
MGSSTRALDTPVESPDAGRKRCERTSRPAASPPVAHEPLGRCVGRRRFRIDRKALSALLLLFIIVLGVVAGPLLSPHPVDTIDPSSRLLPPSWSHPFGTDDLGRDLFARVMVGGRFTIAVALIAVLVALLVGMVGGAAAGFFGGFVDAVVMRTADVVLSIPILLVLLLFSSVVSPGFVLLCLLIGSVQWMEVARVVRSVVLSTRESEFVDAARALGFSDRRILFRHVLPHTGGSVIAASTLALAQAILIESTVSFFGFGLQPPAVSWGALLKNAQGYLAVAPWVAVFPGAMIFATVLSCYVLVGHARSRRAG